MRIEGRGLTVSYPGTSERALEEVSLNVEPGMLYAVLGPNGSGKSTLMRALLGTTRLQSGAVHLGGKPLGEWRRRELAQAIGAVTQTEPTAFPIRVRELVAMGRYPHLGALRPESQRDREIIRDALAQCDMERMADRDVSTLSGGEHQRVRIARALAQEPAALVLDEPTASLDIRHEMEILQLLRRSADQGMTVLLITHHLDLAARFADRILVLGCGRVAAEGTPTEVFREEILEAVYGWPVEVRIDELTGAPRVIPRS